MMYIVLVIADVSNIPFVKCLAEHLCIIFSKPTTKEKLLDLLIKIHLFYKPFRVQC